MKTTKRSDRRILLRFILIIVASGLLGFFASILVGYLTDGEGLGLSGVWEALGAAVPAAFLLLNVLAAGCALALCRSVERQAGRWDGEDESIEHVEQRLNYPMVLANTMTVLNFLFFSASIETIEYTSFGQRYEPVLFPLCLAVFILGYLWIVLVTNRVVRLEKRLNPEKRGNILDTKFGKQWLESCDEAEKLQIYQAGYSGYKAGSAACAALWVVAILGQLWAGTGVFPVICICAVWLAMLLGSMAAAIRLEKR